MQPEAFELAYNLVAFGNHEGKEVADRVSRNGSPGLLYRRIGAGRRGGADRVVASAGCRRNGLRAHPC